MPKCEYCGKEVILPYRCSFCGHYFCVEHRLHENHNCPNLPPRTFRKEEKVEEKPIEKERIASEGELHFVREQIEKQKMEEPKPKSKLKYLVPLLCISLILISYASYSFGHNIGYDLGYENGYLEGVIDGAGTGYNIRDPTYQEMLNFMASDRTDEN